MSATKKLPVIVKKAEPRFVFVSADRKRYAVTTAVDLAYSGVPLDWDGPTEGDDLEYLGETNPDTPLGAHTVK